MTDLKSMLKMLDASLRLEFHAQNPGHAFVGPSVPELALNRIEELEMRELKINEVDVHRLNLKEDEVLVVKVKSDEVDAEGLNALSKGFKDILKTNKVVVLANGTEDDINLTVVKKEYYPEMDYCANCNCGKKAAQEGK